MEDSQGRRPGSIETAAGVVATGMSLGFSLEFRENTALLTLSNREIEEGVVVDRIVLEVPGVRFPFDVRGGAEQFLHHRCRLRLLDISIRAEEMLAFLSRRLDPARYGFEAIQVSLKGDVGWLSGRFRVGNQSAPFTARFLFEAAGEQAVRIGFYDIRFFGPMPLPVSSLVAQLAKALACMGFEQQGAASIIFHPLRDFTRWFLPVHGWKIPDLAGLRIDRIVIRDGRLRLTSARFPDELPEYSAASDQRSALVEQHFLVFREGCQAYHEAEQALMEGLLDKARRLYLGKGGIEPSHPHAARRLLEIGLSRPDRFDEIEDLARDLLAHDPEFLPALFARAAMQRRRQEPAAGSSYERIGKICVNRGERQDAIMAHIEAGTLLMTDDPSRAIHNFERILELNPDQLQAMYTLTGLYENEQHWYRALRMNLRLTHQLNDPKEIAACHFRMGRIFLERFDDLDKARKHLDAALMHDPGHIDALSAQATTFERRNQPTRAVRSLATLLELADGSLAGNEQLIVETRLRLAALWKDELDDPESALLQYESILHDHPDHLHSLFMSGSLSANLERWDQAAEAFSRLLDLEASGQTLPQEVAKSAAVHLGRIYSQRPGGESEARIFLERAASIKPDDIGVWMGIEKLDRSSANWQGLIEVLQHKASLTDDSDEKLAAILEAARISDRQIGDHQRAMQLYELALQEDPSAPEPVEGLKLLLGKQNRWSDVSVLLSRAAADETDPEVAAGYWAEAGKIHSDNLGDRAGAIQAYEAAVDAGHGTENIKCLLDLYRDAEMFEKIAAVIGRLDQSTFDRDELIDLYIERAEILAEKLERVPEAIEDYKGALQIEPNLPKVQRALADIFFARKMWTESREATLKVLELAGEGGLSAPGKTDLHRRLAVIEQELGDASAAIDQLRIVLSRYESDLDAANQLGHLLRAEERWEELAAFYAQQAERAEGEEAAALHTAAATIWWERLKKLDPAAAQYQLGVDAAPKSKAAEARLASLQRVYASLGNWDEVVWVIRERISLAEDRDKPGLYMAMASILSARLENTDAACECWQSALDVAPDYRPALIMLSRRRFLESKYPEAFELGRKALEPDASGRSLPIESRAAVALDSARAAWACEQLEDASLMYQQHLEAFAQRGYAGADMESFERLELILRTLKRHDELALLYQHWLHVPAIHEREGGLRRALALLLFEHLDQPDEAIAVLWEHVQTHPDDQPAAGDIIAMLRKTSRWERLAALLENQWMRAARKENQIRRLEELAEIYQFRLHEPEQAIVHFKELLEMGYGVAAERLAVIYRQEEMFVQLAELLETLADQTGDPAAAQEYYQKLGRLAKDDLDDNELALRSFQELYSIAPTLENQTRLLDLLHALDDPERLQNFLYQCAEEEELPERRRKLLCQHADLCLAKPDQLEIGLSSLRQAIEIEPEESLARRVLSLYEQLGDWGGAADMQETLIDLAREDSSAARRTRDLARIYSEHLNAPERAIAALEHAIRLDPDWLEPMNDLTEILESLKDWQRLTKLLQDRAETTNDRDQAADLMRRAAGLAFDKLADNDLGKSILSAAAGRASEPAPLLLELAERLERSRDYAAAADSIEEVIVKGAQPPEKGRGPAALYRKIAALRLLADDREAAITALEQALGQDPADEETVGRLDSLYREDSSYIDLALMRENLAGRKVGRPAAEAWFSAATSWLAADDISATEKALRQALVAEPDHQEACALSVRLMKDGQDWQRLLDFVDGLPDSIVSLENFTDSIRACFDHVADASAGDALQLTACRAMLRVEPENPEALWRAANNLLESNEPEEAEALLRRLDVQAASLDADRRYRLDQKLAASDFARGHSDQAENRLKRCIEARPDDPDPRSFLHKLYARGERFKDRVALLLDEAERSGDDRVRIGRLVTAAGIMLEELGDPSGALHVYERALRIAEDDVDIWKKLVELHRLLNDPGRQREALLQVARLSSEDERFFSLRKAACLAHDTLSDYRAARESWSELLSIEPKNIDTLDRLLDLDRQQEEFDQLDQHLTLSIELTDDPTLLTSLLKERAEVLSTRLNRPDEILAIYERLEGLHPSDVGVLRKLSDLYADACAYTKLARTLETRMELASSENERVSLMLQLATIQAEQIDDRQAAFETLKSAAALQSESDDALEKLRSLASESGEWDLVADALEGLAARASDRDREHDLRRRLGLLRWSGGRSEEARSAFTRAAELAPGDIISRRFLVKNDAGDASHIKWLLGHSDLLHPADVKTLKTELVASLQGAEASERIAALRDLQESSPGNLDVARQLAELYRECGEHKALADLLGRMAEKEKDEKRADLWMRQAEILIESGDAAGAAAALSEALEFEGAHRYRVAKELARIQLDDFGDGEAASRALEEAVRLVPDDAQAWQRLSDLYWTARDWSRAETATRRLSELADKDSLPGLFARLGDILTQDGRERDAVDAFRKAIAHDPAYRTAYQRLEELLKKNKDEAELSSFYTEWAASDAAGSLRVALYLNAARHLDRLGKISEAIAALREALKIDPSNPEVHEYLAALLSREGDWEELIEVMSQRLELSDDDEKRVAISFELGEACSEHLDDPVQAAVYFERCLQIDPDHRGALEELADIRYNRKLWEEADRLYQHLGEGGLSSSRFVIAFRRGEISQKLGRPEEALDNYRRSIELNPTFLPSRQNLVDLLRQRGLIEEIPKEIKGLLELLDDDSFDDLRSDYLQQLADVQRQLFEFEDAARLCRIVLDREPDNLHCLRMLREYLSNSMQWEEAVDLLRRELNIETESQVTAGLFELLGDILSMHIKDAPGAANAYREAISLAPERVAPKWKQWKLLRSMEAHDELRDLSRSLVDDDLDEDRLREVHLVLARIEEEHDQALLHFEKVLAMGKAELGLVEELASLYQEMGRWEQYCSLSGQAIEAHIRNGMDQEDALDSYLKLAGVYQERIGDVSRAAACIRRGLELYPRDPELLRRLGNLYASDWETYREAIEVFRELSGMDPTDPELYRYLARLEAARGDIDRTISYYTGLRFLSPMDQEARKFLEHAGAAVKPGRALDRSEWDEIILHPDADCLLQRIFSVLAPYLELLLPADSREHGSLTSVTRDSHPQLVEAAKRAAWFISGRPFSIFIQQDENYRAHSDCGKQPAIIISSTVLDRSTPDELTFFITREIVQVAMGFVLPRKLRPADLKVLLAILSRLARPEADPPIPLPATADQYIEGLIKIAPADVMEMAMPLIRRYALEPRAHDIERWARGVRRTADRVALLASEGLIPAMSVLSRFSEAAGGRDLAFIPDRASVLSRDADLMLLFRFAFSEQFLKLRRKLGAAGATPVQE